jgi:hypothetical protein
LFGGKKTRKTFKEWWREIIQGLSCRITIYMGKKDYMASLTWGAHAT